LGLERLRSNKNFSSTHGSEEIKNTWIRKSNSFIAFCYENIEEDYEGKIHKKELRKKYAEYCKENKISSKSDYVIKRALQDMFGVVEEKCKVMENYYDWFWIGIKFKEKCYDCKDFKENRVYR